MRKLRSDVGVVRNSGYRKLNPTRKRLYRCRCANKRCRQRVTLRKHPATYARGHRCCGACGAPLSVDWLRTLGAEKRKHLCHCGAAHYPHQVSWCTRLQR